MKDVDVIITFDLPGGCSVSKRLSIGWSKDQRNDLLAFHGNAIVEDVKKVIAEKISNAIDTSFIEGVLFEYDRQVKRIKSK